MATHDKNPGGGTPGAGDTGGDPLDEAKKAFRKVGDEFKKKFPGIPWNIILSFLNPYVWDPTAKKAAEAVKESTEKFPFLGSKLVASAIGGLAAAIEDYANKEVASEGIRAVLLKASDWIETFSTHLHEHVKGKTGESYNTKSVNDTAKTAILKDLAECDGVFAKNFMKALLECATPQERDAVKAAYRDAALAWWEEKQILLNGPPKQSEEPKEPSMPLKERFNAAVKAANDGLGKFNAEIAPGVARIKVDAERIRRERAAKATAPDKESWIAKALDAPWKLARKLLWG